MTQTAETPAIPQPSFSDLLASLDKPLDVPPEKRDEIAEVLHELWISMRGATTKESWDECTEVLGGLLRRLTHEETAAIQGL